MNEWNKFGLYIIVALIGAVSHYLKKRYIDNTTMLSFKEYLLTNKVATLKAFGSCIAVAYGYALSGAEVFALATIAGVLTGGYVSDSGLNKANI